MNIRGTIIGVEDSGKSTLLRYLKDPEFKYNPVESATLSAEISKIQSEGEMLLQMTDVAGAEKFKDNLAATFVNRQDVAGPLILAIDVTKPYQPQRDYLLDLLKSKRPDVRMILAVTKMDVPNRRADAVQESDIRNLQRELGIYDDDVVKTSARHHHGARELWLRIMIDPEYLILEQHVKKYTLAVLAEEIDRLMERQSALSRKPDFNVHSLPKEYNEIMDRVTALRITRGSIIVALFRIRHDYPPIISEREKVFAALEKPIKDNLEKFDKRRESHHVSWGAAKKLGRYLLDGLLLCTLFVGPGIKYLATGSALFSIQGKTSDKGKEALGNIRKAPLPNKGH